MSHDRLDYRLDYRLGPVVPFYTSYFRSSLRDGRDQDHRIASYKQHLGLLLDCPDVIVVVVFVFVCDVDRLLHIAKY